MPTASCYRWLPAAISWNSLFSLVAIRREGFVGLAENGPCSGAYAAEEYLLDANRETMVIPLLETREAVENIDSILGVEGLEAVFFRPG